MLDVLRTMSEVTRLYLIRHGATVLTAEDRFAGSTNVQLSDEGRSQAAALAERLKNVPLNAVHASPMDRTVETDTSLYTRWDQGDTPPVSSRRLSSRWSG